MKKCHWLFDKDYVESVDPLGSIVILTTFILTVEGHCVSFYLFILSLISFINILQFLKYLLLPLGRLFLYKIFYSFTCDGEWNCFLNFSFRSFVVSVFILLYFIKGVLKKEHGLWSWTDLFLNFITFINYVN